MISSDRQLLHRRRYRLARLHPLSSLPPLSLPLLLSLLMPSVVWTMTSSARLLLPVVAAAAAAARTPALLAAHRLTQLSQRRHSSSSSSSQAVGWIPSSPYHPHRHPAEVALSSSSSLCEAVQWAWGQEEQQAWRVEARTVSSLSRVVRAWVVAVVGLAMEWDCLHQLRPSRRTTRLLQCGTRPRSKCLEK